MEAGGTRKQQEQGGFGDNLTACLETVQRGKEKCRCDQYSLVEEITANSAINLLQELRLTDPESHFKHECMLKERSDLLAEV